MSKRSADASFLGKTTHKKKKAADVKPAPINTDDRPNTPDTTESTEEQARSLLNNDNVTLPTSEEAVITPKKKTGAKASPPQKKGAKAATPKKKGAKVSPPKKGSKTSPPKKTTVTKAEVTKPPVGNGFWPYAYDIPIPPKSEFWGRKPESGDPRPSPNQPSARESHGQTDPPMWENRGYRYKRPFRYTKHNYQVEPDNVDELPRNRDQEDLLTVKLIDMRPKKKDDPEPKRAPTIYCYKKTPKDWKCKQSIKALNDRRYQAIDRITMDPPWSRIEREYLASLLRDNPDASIWELTELHNDRFKDKDYTQDTGLHMQTLSTGRTVESVRHQYTTYKPSYDHGEPPVNVRWRGDPSAEAKALRVTGRFLKSFGPPSKKEEQMHDERLRGVEVESDDDNTPRKRSPRKKSPQAVDDSDESDDDEALNPPLSRKRRASGESHNDERLAKHSKTGDDHPFTGQARLDDESEDLLALAGGYDNDDTSSLLEEGDDDSEQADEMIEGESNLELDVIPDAVEESATASDQGPPVVKKTVVEQTTVIESTNPQGTSTTTFVEHIESVNMRDAQIHASRDIEIDEDYDDGEE
jgi:hypothetical protein